MERTINGKDILFWIDPAGGVEYQLVACLLSNDFSGTTGTIDSSSKCGDSSAPGNKSSSWSITGQLLASPANEATTNLVKLSGPDLFALWEAGTVFSYMCGPATPIAGDWTLHGTGYFSAFGWTNPNGDKSQFSATVTNAETPLSVVETGS